MSLEKTRFESERTDKRNEQIDREESPGTTYSMFLIETFFQSFEGFNIPMPGFYEGLGQQRLLYS